ncbi:MAG: hypothetical protein Q9163_005672 [Psora crenata]
MSVFALNSSHIGSLSLPAQQQDWPRQPSEPRSKASNTSINTVQHNTDRKVSASSTGSLSSHTGGPLRVRNENVSPSRSASYSTLPKTAGRLRRDSISEYLSNQASPKSSWKHGTPTQSQVVHRSSFLVVNATFDEIDLNTADDNFGSQESQKQGKILGQKERRGLSFDLEGSRTPATETPVFVDASRDGTGGPSIFVTDTAPNSFKRFMTTLRPRISKHRRTLSARAERWTLDEFDSDALGDPDVSKPTFLKGHRKASSWSFNGHTGAVNSTTLGLGPSSIAKELEKGTRLRFLRRSDRSSRTSDPATQASGDISQYRSHVADEAMRNSANSRRKILNELLVSEEGYIDDLKILAHVYFTILASTPQFPRTMQVQVERNLSEILLFHEEILIQLKIVLQDKALTHGRAPAKHHRWHSVDNVEGKPCQKGGHTTRRSMESLWFRQFKPRSVVSEPQKAADVARVFGCMMPGFVVYEEYGARYELMLQLVASISKTIPSWWAYERGIEALVNSLMSKKITEDGNKKSLTLEDLLIKPIQRVCRYPLFFAELHKNSPALDDAESEAVIRKVLDRMRETAQEINKATNDRQARVRIQRSSQLQALLLLSDMPLQPSVFRTLGHMRLCGVLYVVFHSQNEVRGDYMLCALFDAHLLLAIPETGNKRFKVVAIVSTTDIHIERADGGRGLQCDNVLYTWKLVFGFEQQLYELMMCACSPREEDQWKTELSRCSEMDNTLPAALDSIFLGLSMRPLGFVPGQPGTLSRRMAIQRAATVDRHNNGCQIIIKNTHSVREGQDATKSPSASLNRSQSLISHNHTPILAPDRADRVRLEHALEDVWTRDLLPFPGMATNRGGAFIRASKNSVMRKLSKASTASQSSKRSLSYTSTIDPFVDDGRDEDRHSAQNSIEKAIKLQGEQPAVVRATFEDNLADPSDNVSNTQDDGSRKVSFKASRSRENSDTTVVAMDDSVEDRAHSTKPKKSKTLLKAFSAEGIRTWFS